MTGVEMRRLLDDLADYRPQRQAIDKGMRASEKVVIEFPFPGRERSVPRCCRVGTDGRQCELPATHGDQCLRHFRWFALYQSMHALPLPEDPLSLQEMLAYTVDMVLSKRTTADEARAVAELCRIMEKNLERCDRQLKSMAEAAKRRPRVIRLASEPKQGQEAATPASVQPQP